MSVTVTIEHRKNRKDQQIYTIDEVSGWLRGLVKLDPITIV